MKNPGIVIVSYNRPQALRRLLQSLLTADYMSDSVTLHISIDHSPIQKELVAISESINWPFGDLNIVAHKDNLGLKKHVLLCGDLSAEHDFLIMLEDDLLVSDSYYLFAKNAITVSALENRVAGIALYSPEINEVTLLPFRPVRTLHDNYYAQLPCSWGQVWNVRMWSGFSKWLANKTNNELSSLSERLPYKINRWPLQSWKKLFCMYLIENDKYFLYPYQSLTTNFGDSGVHMTSNTRFQVKLSHKRAFELEPLNGNAAVYDMFLEILPEWVMKNSITFTDDVFFVNLFGYKEIDDSVLQLTTIRPKKIIKSFSSDMASIEENVLYQVEGEGLYLGYGVKKLRGFSYIKRIFRDYKIPLTSGLVRRIFGR